MEIFNEYVVEIFDILLESFPIPQRFDTHKLVQERGEVNCRLFKETIRFLIHEGFITGKVNIAVHPDIDDLRLTSKGLAILESVPHSLEGKKTFSQRIKEVANSSSKQIAPSLVTEFIKYSVLNT